MRALYEFTDYRAAFAALFERERQRPLRQWSLAALAKQVGLQASYLTNVIKERAHFSADQIHAIAEALALTQDEAEYLTLLMEWERAIHPGRKEALASELEVRRRKNLRVENYVATKAIELSERDLEKYYLDPNIELIHLYLGTEKAQHDPAQLAKLWGFSNEYLAEILEFLQGAGLLRWQKGQWKRETIRHHLAPESPLCRPHQTLARLRAIEILQRLPGRRVHSFAATVTMSEEARLEIQSRFLEFLQACEGIVKASRPVELYQIQFDMFPWL